MTPGTDMAQLTTGNFNYRDNLSKNVIELLFRIIAERLSRYDFTKHTYALFQLTVGFKQICIYQKSTQQVRKFTLVGISDKPT